MRKLATATAVSLILASSGAHALGLGDIEMRSALNQPMNAQIRLTSVQPGEADGMIVKLAPAEAFTRAGIERSQVLTSLKFAVDYNGPSPVIRITSSTPVVEPFLNFLLEVQWPTGRMVREYTVLLDPPVFMTPNASNRSTAGDSPVLVERGELATVVPTPIERNTNASVTEEFDESSVVVVGTAEEIADDAGTEIALDEALLGEEISLDNLEVEEVAADADQVVSLTDLEAPNTEALETIATAELEPATVEYDFPEVELVGGTEEVSNDFVAGDADSEVVDLGTEVADSEVVSLESLSEEEFTVEVMDGSAEVASATGEVTVKRGQTLGEIANNNAVSGVSTQQMLMALLNANQGAFINNNVNLVKAGAILRIPDAAEAAQLSQSQAVAQLSEQNQLWREYRDNVRAKSATQLASTASNDSSAAASEDSAEAAEDSAEAVEQTTSTDVATAQSGASDELKIVAGDETASASADAATDEAADSTAAKLGEINRKLQLAREELASTRLESEDLGEQVASLEGTDEDLNTLVKLRQNEVAQLQEQLRKTTAEQAQAAASEAESATDTLTAAVDDAGTKLADAGESVTDQIAAVTDSATDSASVVATGVTDKVNDATDAATETGSNALTAAGQTLEQVDLVDDDSDTAAATDAASTAAASITPAKAEPWYQKLFRDYGKFGLMGLLGLCLLGLVGLLFKKRGKTEDRLDFDDEVEFVGDDEIKADVVVASADADGKGVSGAAAAAAASTAAASTAAASMMDSDDAEEDSAVQASIEDDEIDGDDTISEVDVYLAYGLHGQAEELLTKAVERDPNNSEYSAKLLQTYHAQSNTEAFNAAAADFQQKYGEDNEHWAGIAALGHELQPTNMIYSGGAEQISRVGSGDLNAPKLDSDDFMSAGEETVGSINRDFSADDTAADETGLMDESLDPGFAFDEADLEATGDFSEAAAEVAEETGTIDFPDFDKTDVQTVADDSLDGAMTLDELDIGDATAANGVSGEQGSVAEDLTLDLDKLSGDLELDSTELLDSDDATALEIPDLTSDNELLTSADGADEMDTMMDLAKAYIDMGDKDSASSALGEIVKSGTPAQVSEAETLLRKIS